MGLLQLHRFFNKFLDFSRKKFRNSAIDFVVEISSGVLTTRRKKTIDNTTILRILFCFHSFCLTSLWFLSIVPIVRWYLGLINCIITCYYSISSSLTHEEIPFQIQKSPKDDLWRCECPSGSGVWTWTGSQRSYWIFHQVSKFLDCDVTILMNT